MNNQGEIVAFLATRLRDAQTDITRGYRIASTSGPDRGEVIYDGATRPFRIVTNERQLCALRLHDFVILDHAIGGLPRGLVDHARARLP